MLYINYCFADERANLLERGTHYHDPFIPSLLFASLVDDTQTQHKQLVSSWPFLRACSSHLRVSVPRSLTDNVHFAERAPAAPLWLPATRRQQTRPGTLNNKYKARSFFAVDWARSPHDQQVFLKTTTSLKLSSYNKMLCLLYHIIIHKWYTTTHSC